ncbi:hypothetical protein MUK42_19113 [Musa troglodytarum]|nr:hypothetical protein MUK42_19113 [Musa troglodytarum]URD82461.1 hypothetical protein MUK42_19113 [Musa troglodytarum]
MKQSPKNGSKDVYHDKSVSQACRGFPVRSRRLVKWMFVRISLWEHIPQHCPTVVDQIVPQNLLEQRHPIYTKFALVSSVALKQMVNAASFIFDVRQFVVSPALHLLSKIFRLGYCAACSQDG